MKTMVSVVTSGPINGIVKRKRKSFRFYSACFLFLLFVIHISFIKIIHIINEQTSIAVNNTQSKRLAPFSKNEVITARLANGTLGLVINPSHNFLQNHTILERKNSCTVNKAIDPIAFEVFKLIRMGVIKSHELLKKRKLKNTNSPKILCMVYTHSHAHFRIKAIVNTWGSQCDGFFAASNETPEVM